MKLGILAASTIVGVASLVPAASAQNDVMLERSRVPAAVDSASANRTAPPTAARALEGARLPAGMLPEKAPGPTRSLTGNMSSEPPTGGALHRSLRGE
jgi:hypothetical protein